MTPEEMQHLRELAAVATDAPWCFYNDDLWQGTAEALAAYDGAALRGVDDAPWPYEDKPWPDSTGHLFHGDPCRPEDAEFIAAARNAIPDLLDEADRVAKAREVIVRAEAMSKAGPDRFKTGQSHLSPAFREVNWEQAFKAVAGFLAEIENAVMDPEPPPECACAMTEGSMRACPVHGEEAPDV